MTRIGTVFHEKLALNRPALVQIIQITADKSIKLNKDTMRERTHLGENYLRAMPLYAVGTGLITSKEKHLTAFGEVVLKHDPDLNHPATLWLMHYHLSAPKGPGPTFWNYLVSHVLFTGVQLKRSEIRKELEPFILKNGKTQDMDSESEENKKTPKSLSSTVGIFTGTYTTHGLENLQILRELEQNASYTFDNNEDKLFEVLEPETPPTFALGYALAHYWEQEVNALRTNLSSLSDPGGFASLFFMGTYGLNSALRELQREGYVELEQISPPHQLVRRWESKDVFLERLYE